MWYSYETQAFQGEVFEEGSSLDHASQDSWLLQDNGSAMRCVVIDGISPTLKTPSRAGVDGAIWAANLVRTTFQAWEPLAFCSQIASSELHTESIVSPRDQQQACVLAVDCQQPSKAKLLRAGDCQAWVREGKEWRVLWPDYMYQPTIHQTIDDWRRAHSKTDEEGVYFDSQTQAEIYAKERELLECREQWLSTPLGSFAQPLVEELTLKSFEELIIATDGVCLDKERLQQVSASSSQEHRAQHYATFKRRWHDDIALIRIAPRL
jgi:hypothetical protein